ncbi:hypothetical protein PV08_01678 [Exophiala spinifera]|uniref:NmrA-like domain-containing protein n=1 Tax=Exophiala spinifera TaxID=91928 RepID=A0A0D2CC92_9EURO|nr:uncharacterized protein PV08_01678 [Exophiala spinifera]KIW21099.1 hypothetical protein PV08_01678 [Exophiala spinifera]
MKVAVAGTGDVASYLIEELGNYGHEVVVLTRSSRAERSFEQRETDYTVSSLVSVLHDCEALVSTVADYSNLAVGVEAHLNMLEACLESAKCKTFVPSEWTCDTQTYPDEPSFLRESNELLHGKLAAASAAKDIRTTIVCTSWFADYVLPASNRHLRDIGALWPMDHGKKVFTVYGPGTQVVDLVPARDVARALAVLLDSEEPWDLYTYFSGHQLTWNELFAIVKRRDPAWTSVRQSLAATLALMRAPEHSEDFMRSQFEILSYTGASRLPGDKVQEQRTKFFPLAHFRTVEELLDNAVAKPDGIL